MRKVARDHGITIPERLREVAPPIVKIQPEVLERGLPSDMVKGAKVFDLGGETIPELADGIPRVKSPAATELLQRQRAEAEDELDKKEKARRKRLERRKAVLAQQKPKGKGR